MSDASLETRSFTVHRLGHVAIRVQDVGRAKDFYLSLGMSVVWDDEDWCYLETKIRQDGLALLGPNYKQAGPHFAFHFTDLEELKAFQKQLQKEGNFVGDLHQHRDGTASFYLKDPEGNWLEMLYHPKEGIPTNHSK